MNQTVNIKSVRSNELLSKLNLPNVSYLSANNRN